MRNYTLQDVPATKNFHGVADLQLAFDVGHSSLGWAVLQCGEIPHILGAGAVIFQADDCLASRRRNLRRQRRHIRATRQRISRIQRLLAHLDVIPKEELARKHQQAGGHAAPWLLSARVLRGGPLLTWRELWDVIRWYAHNRGYDGNKVWSPHEIEAKKEDTKKVENARFLYTRHRTGTMAETFCAVSGLNPLGRRISCNLHGHKRPKALNAAFPREDVEREVRTVLEKHLGTLPKLDESFIRALMEDWTAIPCESIRLPDRYGQILANGKRSLGGLLFGQLVPRFENRIIATCPMTFQRVYQDTLAKTNNPLKARHEATKFAKVPAKNCPEFLRFRWAMQVANIQIATGDGNKTRPLSPEERKLLDDKMRQTGFLTGGEFKKAVRQITGGALDNLDQMLTHPDADQALILDPARKALSSAPWDSLFPLLPAAAQKRATGKLRRGKTITLADLAADIPATLDNAIEKLLTAQNTRKSRKQTLATREELLAATARCAPLPGRAPCSRAIMKEVADFVFSTAGHPAEEGGPLYRSDAIRATQLQRTIDEQTNNHLVRHRLLILERLHRDILGQYAGGDSSRIARVTIEVNRDLRELSGKTSKQVASDIGQRLANFKSVTDRLQKAFDGRNIRITPGLIRKARIAEDLGWTCPYTGKGYDEFDLLHRNVDKDHIIPHGDRPSDSLDSLVITFAEVNRMKGRRTAARFIEECQGQTVAGRPDLTIKTPSIYNRDIDSMESFRGHDDDKRRKKRRKDMLRLRDCVEKEFTPRDLTQTSQLVRLGAQVIERAYITQEKKPVITSLPGSVTAAVRKSWRLLGCLATANPHVLNQDDPDEHGNPRTHSKTEIRRITHLHHALDACALALASHLLPRDGGVWELLVKRQINSEEQNILRSRLGPRVAFTQEGKIKIEDLPPALKENIRLRLAERRVVQHIPKEMRGLPAQLNAWRVVRVEENRAVLKQRVRQANGTRKLSQKDVELTKLIGLNPKDGHGKLEALKAALILDSNFGIAILDHAQPPQPSQTKRKKQTSSAAALEMIPYHKVWKTLADLQSRNHGHMPRILRRGMLIRVKNGTCRGAWRILSVKNNATGLAVDVTSPDGIDLIKQNQKIANLLRDGLEILNTPLTGVPTGDLPETEPSIRSRGTQVPLGKT